MYKKIMLLGLAAMMVGVMGSCKKDYECDCHLDDQEGNHTDEELMIQKSSKSDAEDACHEFEHAFEESGMYSEVDCQLK